MMIHFNTAGLVIRVWKVDARNPSERQRGWDRVEGYWALWHIEGRPVASFFVEHDMYLRVRWTR